MFSFCFGCCCCCWSSLSLFLCVHTASPHHTTLAINMLHIWNKSADCVTVRVCACVRYWHWISNIDCVRYIISYRARINFICISSFIHVYLSLSVCERFFFLRSFKWTQVFGIGDCVIQNWINWRWITIWLWVYLLLLRVFICLYFRCCCMKQN